MVTKTPKKIPCAKQKKSDSVQECFFYQNIDKIGNGLKEILEDYTNFSKVQMEQKTAVEAQAEQMERLTATLSGISTKLENSFELGKAFIKLFRLILIVMLFVVTIFGVIVVYITNVDITTQYLSLQNSRPQQTQPLLEKKKVK